MTLTVCIWLVQKSWLEAVWVDVDTRCMVETYGVVFNLRILIFHRSSLSDLYFKAWLPPFTLHLHYGAFIRCANPHGLIIRPQKDNKIPQAQPSIRGANRSLSAPGEQREDDNESSLMPN